MLPGLYSAATGLEVATRNQEIISHNLAHVSVPGFRRSVVSFESFEAAVEQQRLDTLTANSGTVSDTEHIDFTAGTYSPTGRKLDVAVQGDGFFSIDGPEGTLYTRRGGFQVSPTGQLVNHEGYPVRGAGGPIQFPLDVAAEQIEIATNGQIRYQGAVLGQLELTAFEDNQKLIAAGTTLFEAGPEAVASDAEVEVMQGVRELSNVSPMQELVRMIIGMRFYEMSTKAMNALDTAIQRSSDPTQGG